MEQKFSFKGPRGWNLRGHSWRANGGELQGTLICIHGYSEHGGCYAHFAKFLNTHGLQVFGLDLPGHGESDGARSNIDDFEDYLLCIDALIKEIGSQGSGKPFFLFGHSLGGLISLRFIETRENHIFQKLALSSPLLGIHGFSRWTAPFVRLFCSVAPNFGFDNERRLGNSVLTHDRNMEERRKQDPLIKSRVTSHWVLAVLKEIEKANQDSTKIRVPSGFFLAGDDLVVEKRESIRFFEGLEVKPKRLQEYPGFYHEILNEIGREQVMNDILEWLSSGVVM